MSAPIRVLVCDDQALIRTGFATIIDAQPDLEVVGECGDGWRTAGGRHSAPSAATGEVRAAARAGNTEARSPARRAMARTGRC